MGREICPQRDTDGETDRQTLGMWYVLQLWPFSIPSLISQQQQQAEPSLLEELFSSSDLWLGYITYRVVYTRLTDDMQTPVYCHPMVVDVSSPVHPRSGWNRNLKEPMTDRRHPSPRNVSHVNGDIDCIINWCKVWKALIGKMMYHLQLKQSVLSFCL